MTTYRVWDPDRDDEADAREYSKSFDEEDAAIDHAEYRCDRDSEDYGYYTDGVELSVRNLDDNKLYTVSVECRAEPTFYGSMKKEKA